jgi:hypothetical protein
VIQRPGRRRGVKAERGGAGAWMEQGVKAGWWGVQARQGSAAGERRRAQWVNNEICESAFRFIMFSTF